MKTVLVSIIMLMVVFLTFIGSSSAAETEKEHKINLLRAKFRTEKTASIADMDSVSDCVVRGKVKTVTTWIVNGLVETKIDLAVKRAFRSAYVLCDELSVCYAGGTVVSGDVMTVVDVIFVGGTPEFTRGQEVLVFLVAIPGEDCYRLVLDRTAAFSVKNERIYPLGKADGTGMSIVDLEKRLRKEALR